MVGEYIGISLLEVNKLPYISYLLYKRDAWIYKHQESEPGREFLKDLFVLQESNADYEKVGKVSTKC